MANPSRRKLLGSAAGILGTVFFAKTGWAAIATPRASEGPFYPLASMRRSDVDNDLVKIAGMVEQAGGEVVTLRGVIKDRNGSPLPNHRIEIWQCDLKGHYMHPRDRRNKNFDPAFQGFGHDITDENGSYFFRTIKPARYPGRTPHIHVKVLNGDQEVLTTQFYIKGHPDNQRDFLFNFMSDEDADRVSMDFVSGPEGTEATLDVVI